MRKILGSVIDANNKFKLIEENDKIAVGVSGGKDSVLLLHALNTYKQYAPFKFDVIGITLQMGFQGMDFQPIVDFCNRKNIEYNLVPTKIYDVLQKKADDKGKIQCALCSKFKKALLINEAKKRECNKVSMAHHFDDGIETLFMNAIYNGFFASFQPKMYLDRTDVTFIRPFILCEEKDINSAVLRNKIPIVLSTCPQDKKTSREKVKNWLNGEVYKQFPTAKNNFKNSLLNTDRVVLWDKDKE